MYLVCKFFPHFLKNKLNQKLLRCESYVKQDNLCHNKYGKNREDFFACSFFSPYEPDTVFMLTVCFTKSGVSSQLVKNTLIWEWYIFSDQVKKIYITA